MKINRRFYRVPLIAPRIKRAYRLIGIPVFVNGQSCEGLFTIAKSDAATAPTPLGAALN